MSDRVLRFPDRTWDEVEGLPQPLRNAEIIEVNEIRAALGARPAENATLHLGEAEIIYHLTAHQPGWTFHQR